MLLCLDIVIVFLIIIFLLKTLLYQIEHRCLDILICDSQQLLKDFENSFIFLHVKLVFQVPGRQWVVQDGPATEHHDTHGPGTHQKDEEQKGIHICLCHFFGLKR